MIRNFALGLTFVAFGCATSLPKQLVQTPGTATSLPSEIYLDDVNRLQVYGGWSYDQFRSDYFNRVSLDRWGVDLQTFLRRVQKEKGERVALAVMDMFSSSLGPLVHEAFASADNNSDGKLSAKDDLDSDGKLTDLDVLLR